ncbi:MAG: hypothetical protein RMJ53_07210 [Chitinophagales bacterium]|nr:hypothetical protein [Chitinophagales bacterium]
MVARKARYHLIVLLFITFFEALANVELQMSFDPAGFQQAPFRVNYGDTLTYAVTIKNIGTASYNGSIKVLYTGTLSSIPDTIFLGQFQFNIGDSVSLIISIPVTNKHFKTGPEVVVVWPLFDGGSGNQIADFIFVNSSTSISEYSYDNNRYYIRYGKLFCKSFISPFVRVRIFDFSGRLISDDFTDTFPYILPLFNHPYFLLVDDTESRRRQILRVFNPLND